MRGSSARENSGTDFVENFKIRYDRGKFGMNKFFKHIAKVKMKKSGNVLFWGQINRKKVTEHI